MTLKREADRRGWGRSAGAARAGGQSEWQGKRRQGEERGERGRGELRVQKKTGGAREKTLGSERKKRDEEKLRLGGWGPGG